MYVQRSDEVLLFRKAFTYILLNFKQYLPFILYWIFTELF